MTDTATKPPQEALPDDVDGSPGPPPAPPAADDGTQGAAGSTGAPGGASTSEPAADAKTPEDKRSVEEIAQDYLIPVSQAAIQAWSDRPQEYLPYAIETAKGLYPTLADKLTAGITTKILVDPYVQVAKQILGPNTEPDFMDPKWGKALDGGRDAKGNPALMPLSAWRQLLQSDPAYGYDRTGSSHAVADNLASTIHGAFTGQTPLPQQTAQQQSLNAPPAPEAQSG